MIKNDKINRDTYYFKHNSIYLRQIQIMFAISFCLYSNDIIIFLFKTNENIICNIKTLFSHLNMEGMGHEILVYLEKHWFPLIECTLFHKCYAVT